MNEKQKLYETHILLVVTAQPPKALAAYRLYGNFTAQFLVERKTGTIKKANFNVISPLTQEFLADLVTGYRLCEPLNELFSNIRTSFYGASASTVIQTIKVAAEKYVEIAKNNPS